MLKGRHGQLGAQELGSLVAWWHRYYDTLRCGDTDIIIGRTGSPLTGRDQLSTGIHNWTLTKTLFKSVDRNKTYSVQHILSPKFSANYQYLFFKKYVISRAHFPTKKIQGCGITWYAEAHQFIIKVTEPSQRTRKENARFPAAHEI